MAFIMRVLKSTEWWWAGVAILVALLVGNAQAQAFEVDDLSSRVEGELLTADARIDYDLSETAIEALENGVPLVIRQNLVLERPRWWWRNVQIASRERAYRLQYHAMSRRYVLTWLASGESRSYRSLDALLAILGRIEGWPVVRSARLDSDRNYRLGLKTALDLDALPRLLRTVAYVDSDWQLASQTHHTEVTR